MDTGSSSSSLSSPPTSDSNDEPTPPSLQQPPDTIDPSPEQAEPPQSPEQIDPNFFLQWHILKRNLLKYQTLKPFANDPEELKEFLHIPTRLRTPPLPPNPADDPNYFRPKREANYEFYEDRQQRGIADILSRFTKLVQSVPMADEKEDDGSAATREMAASKGFVMEAETAALVKAAEDLLRLTRELKELWLFGPLRGIGEGEGEGKMDEDSVKVGAMLENILRKDTENQDSKLRS